MKRLLSILFSFLLSLPLSTAVSATDIPLSEVLFFTSAEEVVVEDVASEFSVSFGYVSGGTETTFRSSFESYMEAQHFSWLTLESVSMNSTTRTGTAVFRLSVNLSSDDFVFRLLNGSGDDYVSVRQLSYTDTWIEAAGVRETYFGSKDTIALSGSVTGVTYTLLLDRESVSSVTCGSTLVRFIVNGMGTYNVSASSGRVRGSVVRTPFNFLSKALIVPQVNPALLPNGASNLSMFCTCDSSVQREQLEEMFDAYNDGQVDYWDRGLQLGISAWYSGGFNLSIVSGPNTLTDTLVFDTRIKTSSGTETFVFRQPPGGTLGQFEVTMTPGMSSTRGTVSLSGSEYGVSYWLQDITGYPYDIRYGTGSGMLFENIPSGYFTVVARRGNASLRMQGDTMLLNRPTGTTTECNSVRSVTYTSESGADGMTDISYYDALGALEQEVRTRESGSLHLRTGFPLDVVKPVYYDKLRRSDTKVYLPFVSSDGEGKMVEEMFDSQAQFYTDTFTDGTAYGETVREEAPEGRVVQVIRPGSEYRSGDGHSTTISYGSNTAQDSVRRFTLLSGDRIKCDGLHNGGTLATVKVRDEDGRTVTLFSDFRSRIILERRELSDGQYADTYYGYDSRDSLCWTIPPECSARISVGEVLTAGEGPARQYCHVYGYDVRGNVVWRDIPGGGRREYIHDEADREVAMQDEVMANDSTWLLRSYDAIGREVAVYEIKGWSRDSLARVLKSGGAVATAPQTLLRATYYDTYPQIATGFSAQDDFAQEYDSRTKGLKTCEVLWHEGTTHTLVRTFYYDRHGNVIQMVEGDYYGQRRVSATYSFTGKPLREREVFYSAFGATTDVVDRCWGYDHRDRVVSETTSVNGGSEVVVSYSYDALGRLSERNTAYDGVSVAESIVSDMQGRESSRTATLGGNTLYCSELRYHNPTQTATVPQYGGNISEWEWSRGGASPRIGAFGYDALSRLCGNRLYEGGVLTDRFAEKEVKYDLNGNILEMERTANAVTTEITATYTGNHKSVDRYDANGNVIYDAASGLSMEWNRQNLVSKVRRGADTLVCYSYLADGTKVFALDGSGDGKGLYYRGSLVYACEGGVPTSLESVAFNGGRFTAGTDSLGNEAMLPKMYVTDHLGSVRTVVDGYTAEVMETNDYYPFGGRLEESTAPEDTLNRYRYNGKEEQKAFGTPYFDYGARQYTATNARWLSCDPLSAKYPAISPYAFCNNNPINLIDPDGKFPDIIWDVISIGFGMNNLVQNIIAGNYMAALEDGGGIVLDAVAAFVPFIPGGVGYIRAGSKIVKFADTEVDLLRLNAELSDFEKAADFGVDTYKNLRLKVLAKYGTGSGLEVHHLVEQRFAKRLDFKKADMPSIVLTKEEHRRFTADWRNEIGYDNSGAANTTSLAGVEQILNSAKEVYKDYPEVLKIIEESLK